MKNIRLIVATEDDRKAILECQFLTNHATASKAVMAVVRDYARVRTAWQNAELRATKAEHQLKTLKDSLEATLWGDGDLDRRIKQAVDDGYAARRRRRTPSKPKPTE